MATIVSGPSFTTAVPFARFSLVTSAHPQHSFLQYSLDGGPWLHCDTTVRVGPLRPGGHVFRARSLSGDAQLLSAPAVHAWTITESNGSSVAVPGLADGSHTLQLFATDAVGNRQLAPLSYSWIVDTTPPATNVTVAPSPLTRSTAVEVSAVCSSEQYAGNCTLCWWRAGNSAARACSDNSTLSFSHEQGKYVCRVSCWRLLFCRDVLKGRNVCTCACCRRQGHHGDPVRGCRWKRGSASS